MKYRNMKTLLAGLLLSALVTTTLPADLTIARAALHTPTSELTLEELGVIDAPGEEDRANDLPDLNASLQAKPYAAANGDMVIAIDPGHGGPELGAVYGGIAEKNINLKIAQYIKAYFEDYVGVQVYLTREGDSQISLSDRVAGAVQNNADVFISIHNNAATNTSANGSMVFYPNESYRPDLSYEGSGLASSILDQLTGLGLANLGIRIRSSENGSTYDDGNLSDYYGVIRNAKLSGIPGLIVEHAFLSSESDRNNYLSTDAQLRKLAMADVQGIANYYGLTYNGLVEPNVTLSAPSYKELQVEWDSQSSASGYLVYRSDTIDGKYERVAKVIGSGNTTYIDSNIKLGKTYYYKVRAYGSTAGVVFFSEYSPVVQGYTIGGTQLTSIKQMTGGYFKLKWKTFEGADGYAIYRSTEGGAYKRIATISDPAKNAYNDKTAEPGTNYNYKVRTIHTLYDNEGFGKSSTAVAATLLKAPELKRLDIRDDGNIKVVWTKALGTSGYVLQRATQEEGTYHTLATITDDKVNYYLDKNVERGMTYYYRVIAYNKHGLVSGSTGYVESMGAKNFQTPEFTEVAMADDHPGVSLAWTKAAGANGYRIYRSTRESGGYEKIATLKGSDTLSYADNKQLEAGTTYYYKVKAYVYTSAGTIWSDGSGARSVLAGYGIMGESNTTPRKMAAFFTARGGVYRDELYSEFGAPTLDDFCQIVYDEAEAEGVRAEVVFAQICKETGFLRFGGDVEPEQCNFAGIGATGGGAKGASFPDVETGIRAQVQHLKAYASDLPLNQECVDPRFTYVKRLTAIYVEWLGIQENPTGAGWATGKNYGYSLRDDYIRPLLSY